MALYHQRWEIELGFREIKQTLQEGEPVLRSKQPALVRQELWGVLIAYTLLRRWMREMAAHVQVEPQRISFHTEFRRKIKVIADPDKTKGGDDRKGDQADLPMEFPTLPIDAINLLHSVYGNAFVDLVKFDPASERARLRELVGESAEHLVYLFCTQSRTQFVQKVLGQGMEADGSLLLDKDGTQHRLTPYEVAVRAAVPASGAS